MNKHLSLSGDLKTLIFIILILALTGSISAAVFKDFDGDGKVDYVVRRYQRSGNYDFITFWVLKSSDGSYSATQWGYNPVNFSTVDGPALGDFDGDGKTDIGVRRTAFASPPIQTYFYILRSSDNTFFALQWGLSGDYSMLQDYDADGVTDFGVVRPTSQGNVWYLLQSRRGFRVFNQGGGGFPIRGDFDGDRRADFAVYAADANNNWFFYIWSNREPQTLTVKQLGNGTADEPLTGDFDGDRKTDVAVWRGVNNHVSGFWQWIRSSDGGIGTAQLGTGFSLNDYPIPEDYDGDGKTDPAIFRRGEDGRAYFLVRGSQRGLFTVQWGLATDDGY